MIFKKLRSFKLYISEFTVFIIVKIPNLKDVSNSKSETVSNNVIKNNEIIKIMISKKYAQPLFMIFMSFSMSVIMSGVVVAVNSGVADGFIGRWFYSWMFAFPVALIAAFTMAPIMRPLVNKIASKE